jgi:hypothetical protein
MERVKRSEVGCLDVFIYPKIKLVERYKQELGSPRVIKTKKGPDP